jgi:hypothetical protein
LWTFDLWQKIDDLKEKKKNRKKGITLTLLQYLHGAQLKMAARTVVLFQDQNVTVTMFMV